MNDKIFETDYWDYSKPPPQYGCCYAREYGIECPQVTGKRRYCVFIPKTVVDDPSKYDEIDMCPYYPFSKEKVIQGKSI